MRKSRRSSSGYTLAELLLVLACMAITAAVALPRYERSIHRYKAELAVRRIAADLAQARAQARSRSVPVTISFDAASNSYTLAGASSLDGRSNAYLVDLAADPYRCSLSAANFSGASQVTFDPYGSANAGGQVVVTCGGIDATVSLEASSGKATVP